jgi:xanthine dehydrogenase molybdopterin-binding subunit B
MITGRRHCFWYEYEVGYDDEGRVLGAEISMVSRAGHSADLSAPVMTRALCHFDNTYWLPDVLMHGYMGKTNTQSNTAFRGFGGPQGAIAIENILDTVARSLGRDPLDVRRVNFYGKGERNITPYEQVVTDNVIHELVAELEESSDYRAPCGRECLQRRQCRAQARPGADAAEVRHLLQCGPLQPGRRTGPYLYRWLDSREPWRHRNGPGPEHQGGAGGGA